MVEGSHEQYTAQRTMSQGQPTRMIQSVDAEATGSEGLEHALLSELEHIFSTGDNPCYAALALMQYEYDPSILAGLARERRQDQRIGYMAEVGAHAASLMHLTSQHEKLTALCRKLEHAFDQWQHLNPTHPGWGKRINMQPRHLTETNRRWRVYSRLRAEEMEDFVDLYMTKDYARYSPVERHEMRERGVKYTRMSR